MFPQTQILDEQSITSRIAGDFCKIFNDEMHSLYLLAFLLTADKDKAEECYLGGLRECVERIGVWVGRPRFWARRAVVSHAVRMIRPIPGKDASWLSIADLPAYSTPNSPFEVIVRLSAFERFVFVMSILEGQPDEDCQNLLGCSRQAVVTGRKAAMRFFVTANANQHAQDATHVWPTLLN